MPIYEYTCEKCGNNFEALLKSASSPAPECPECSSAKVKRRLSSFAAKVNSTAPCGAKGACPSSSPSGCGCGGCCHHNH